MDQGKKFDDVKFTGGVPAIPTVTDMLRLVGNTQAHVAGITGGSAAISIAVLEMAYVAAVAAQFSGRGDLTLLEQREKTLNTISDSVKKAQSLYEKLVANGSIRVFGGKNASKEADEFLKKNFGG